MNHDSNAHVLIVDDDTSFLAAAAEIAEFQGLSADTAATLAAARTKLRAARFDLVLLDLALPDGNGLSLLDEVDLADNVRIAIITGNPSVESAVRAIHLPVLDYLVKPLNRGALHALFAKAQSSARQRSAPYSAGNRAIGESSPLRVSRSDENIRQADAGEAFQLAQTPSQISFSVGMTLEEVERQMLFKTMAYFNNHKPKAAEALGISLKTVYNRLARFGYASHPAESRPLESQAAAVA